MTHPSTSPRPRALRVVLDAWSTRDDTTAIVQAISLLRHVTHAGPLANLDLGSPVEVLELSARPLNALLNARIATLEDLTTRSANDLRRVKNLGKIGLREIEERLEAVELSLRPPELDADRQSSTRRLTTPGWREFDGRGTTG